MIIIELCGLERETVGAEQAVGLAHERLLPLVGAEQETLEFNDGVIARAKALAAGYLPLFSQVADGGSCFLHATALPVRFIGSLREPVHGDDDTVQTAHHQPFSHRTVEGLRVGRDDGVKPLLYGIVYHLRQMWVEQRLALEEELNGVGIAEGVGKQRDRIVGERVARRSNGVHFALLLCHADGALGAGELADVGGLDSKEGGVVRNMHYAEEA